VTRLYLLEGLFGVDDVSKVALLGRGVPSLDNEVVSDHALEVLPLQLREACSKGPTVYGDVGFVDGRISRVHCPDLPARERASLVQQCRYPQVWAASYEVLLVLLEVLILLKWRVQRLGERQKHRVLYRCGKLRPVPREPILQIGCTPSYFRSQFSCHLLIISNYYGAKFIAINRIYLSNIPVLVSS
jgi:hypothetical protein